MKRSNFIVLSLVVVLLCSAFVIKKSMGVVGSSNNKRVVGLNIGDTAPEIAQAGVDGKTMKLSALKNKIVLIDFWASWCRPCRVENPTVVKAYNDFKDKKMKGGKKGFTVFSVSLDQNADAWKQAIVTDGLIWKEHTSDLKGWSNAVAQTYGVRSIPTNFLIDGNGVIIAKGLRGEALIAELQKLVQ